MKATDQMFPLPARTINRFEYLELLNSELYLFTASRMGSTGVAFSGFCGICGFCGSSGFFGALSFSTTIPCSSGALDFHTTSQVQPKVCPIPVFRSDATRGHAARALRHDR